MRKKLLYGALVMGFLLGGSGAAPTPASAELRTVTIKLANGREIQTTVDVPPGSPAGDGTPAAGAPQQGDPPAPAGTSPSDESDNADEGGDPKVKPSPSRPKRKRGGKRRGSKRKSKTRRAQDTREEDNLTLALPGPAPIGVPNFIISKFRIPPFLLPIYQAAGIQYGIRWEVLAAINEIETDYGRNLNVSSAGAVGWMQFLPSSWKTYGVDANADGEKDPYNPVDAIFAAARYLKAAGARKDIRRAIFAYNPANWYVDSVLMRARLIAGLPADLVGSITGLTQGYFPVAARSRYEGSLRRRDVRRLSRKVRRSHNAARLVKPDRKRRSINIYSRRGAPAIAVNDGVVKRIGRSRRLGRHVVLQDVYGNRYTYAHLGRISKRYPVPKRTGDEGAGRDDFRPARGADAPKPTAPATAGRQLRQARAAARTATRRTQAPPAEKERLFANPTRRANRRLAEENGQFSRALLGKDGFDVFRKYFAGKRKLSPRDVRLKRLKKGSKVIAGTVLGRIGRIARGPGSGLAPHLNFSIRPAGRGAPRIDPKPILDGWKLLEATAIYRAAGKNPFLNARGDRPTVGQILLMSKETLARRVLSNPRIDIYRCGRSDIRSGQIDRRVLATLEFLAAWELRPTVTSLKCGHSYYTKSGNVSDHSSGNAVDIARINDIPILGNQDANSVTERAVGRLLTLQGAVRPTQIISLLDVGGPTLAMADHADHIHVGFRPRYGVNTRLGRQARRLLANNQWDKLVARLGSIRNPVVSSRPSKYSIKVKRDRRRAGDTRTGD